MSLRQPCKGCGCEAASHFKDQNDGVRYNCLNINCECQMYWDERQEKRPELPKKVEPKEETPTLPMMPVAPTWPQFWP